MSNFFHDEEPNRPSQMKLITDADHNYCHMYDKVTVTSTHKNNNLASVNKYRLKKYSHNIYPVITIVVMTLGLKTSKRRIGLAHS